MDIPEQDAGSKKRRLLRWLKIFLLIYCLLGITVYYLQDYFILHPKQVDRDTPYTFNQPFVELNIGYDDNTNINMVQFTTGADSARGVVLYFHGNKNNIERYAPFAPYFTKNGYEVWMMDYPGFGKSTGRFSEKTVYDWSLIMYNMARKRYSTHKIIIYGKSLGTGVAAHLAAIRDCKYLVLETPYYSITSIASTYLWMYPIKQMLHYRFPTHQYLKEVSAPIIIFHGTNDQTIHIQNAEKLKPLLTPKDDFITIEGGMHNDLMTYRLMIQTLDSLLKR